MGSPAQPYSEVLEKHKRDFDMLFQARTHTVRDAIRIALKTKLKNSNGIDDKTYAVLEMGEMDRRRSVVNPAIPKERAGEVSRSGKSKSPPAFGKLSPITNKYMTVAGIALVGVVGGLGYLMLRKKPQERQETEQQDSWAERIAISGNRERSRSFDRS